MLPAVKRQCGHCSSDWSDTLQQILLIGLQTVRYGTDCGDAHLRFVSEIEQLEPMIQQHGKLQTQRLQAHFYNTGLSLSQHGLNSSARRLIASGLRLTKDGKCENNLVCSCASALLDASLCLSESEDTSTEEIVLSIAPLAYGADSDARRAFAKRFVRLASSRPVNAPRLMDQCQSGLPASLLGIAEARAWEEMSLTTQDDKLLTRRYNLARDAEDHVSAEDTGDETLITCALAQVLQAGTLNDDEDSLAMAHAARESLCSCSSGALSLRYSALQSHYSISAS